MELDELTTSTDQSAPSAARRPAPSDEPVQPSEQQVLARIYPEYDSLSASQIEAESARLKNRLRALAIRFESCDRMLGQALLASHRSTCAEVGASEVLARIAAIEALRANESARTSRGKTNGEGLLGGLIGGRRGDARRSGEGGTEGDLKVPEPIDRELVELARAVASDPRIAELPDETVRASLVKRAELAIEGADIEGRLRFLRRRVAPSTIERPRASGDFRGPPGPSAPRWPDGAAHTEPAPGVSDAARDLVTRLDAIDAKLDQHRGELARALADLPRSVSQVGGTAVPAGADQQAERRHAALLERLVAIEAEFGRRLAAVDLAQRALTEELTEAFTRHEEAQLRILEREESLRAGRLEVANAQLAAETVRKQAAEAELEVARTTHAARMDEEQMRMRVDAARHAHTMREHEDAQARALERAVEESRILAAEQTRAREARTAEIERMARLRSRAESAATSRRLREARERRRNTVVWASVASGLLLVVFGLLWASGLLEGAAQYLRSRSGSPAGLTQPDSPAAPPASAGPATAPTRARPTR